MQWSTTESDEGMMQDDTKRLPPPVPDNRTFTTIETGTASTCAVDSSGSLWCWQIDPGNGNTKEGSMRQISKGRTFVAVSAADGRTCALDTSGDVTCFGEFPYLGWLHVKMCIALCDSGTDQMATCACSFLFMCS